MMLKQSDKGKKFMSVDKSQKTTFRAFEYLKWGP